MPDAPSPTAFPLPISPQDLLSLDKPAQYYGAETNSIIKSADDVSLNVALCFPDTYEVGMSHVGIQILYDLLNGIPDVWAQRAYMPQPDMEQLLRSRNLPLFALESKQPLNTFDVVGFSLQYELCGTNVLAMLDLAQIPRRHEQRQPSDPLVIGGGPYAYHPEPLAAFFDLFFLGDAEEAIQEIISCLQQAKKQSMNNRDEVLRTLSAIDGIYVPSLFRPMFKGGSFCGLEPARGQKAVITRRLLPTMEGAPFPRRPVIPSIKTVHDRLSVEVMRGCVRGCRFCQAGYLYRPQRERPPQEVLNIVAEALPQTGFEEVSLLSLSTADYCSIVPLLKSLMDTYGDGDRLAISFPSTRVDALTPEVLEQVQRVRRTGFTIAPEAGTQRLRDVINKGVSDAQILETCLNVFRMGWKGVKLYFMLGLPTETDEDLEGIIELARRLRSLPEAKGKDITVSVSTFVPKPHTPFQWAEQIPQEEVLRRQRLLREGLRRVRVDFRCHDAFSSVLEGVFARGGREVAAVLERAYELGCRLDAWQDHLREDLWRQALADCGYSLSEALAERNTDAPLPWDHLSCGIDKDYFIKEYRRALRAKETADCLSTSCSICGACDYDERRNILWPRDEALLSLPSKISPARPAKSSPQETSCYRYRLKFSKRGRCAFSGHLQFAQEFHRAARRAGLPLAHTAGYHPQPRVSFGPPLQVGVESDDERVDIYLLDQLHPDQVLERLAAVVPDGVKLLAADEIPLSAPSVAQAHRGARFSLEWLPSAEDDVLRADDPTKDPIAALLDLSTVRESKPRRGRPPLQTQLFFRDFLQDVAFEVRDNKYVLEFTLPSCQGLALRPKDIAEQITATYSLVKISSFLSS